MSDEQFLHYIKTIQQQIAVPKRKLAEASEEIAIALEGLRLIYEEMQMNLDVAETIEEGLLQQNQQLITDYRYYYDLFHSSQVAYLVTDANGLILEANQAIAQLLNVTQSYLLKKPLAIFIPQEDRPAFRTKLNRLSVFNDLQIWQMNLCPKKGEPFMAELNVVIIRDDAGWIERLQISVYNMSRSQQRAIQIIGQQNSQESSQLNSKAFTQSSPLITPLPQSLDGLQVLIVDDEADAREFITAVLESHGIRVTAVATAAAALETLEQFHPDVLVSDIRMPDEDGYSLIHQVRELEARQGWHIPAAALTAYLTEDREKALSAGFEAHLHKLAQPTELIELVAQLARRTSNQNEQ